MFWQKRKSRKPDRFGQSIIKKLREEGKSNEDFEIIFNRLSLEEVIWLKIELSSRLFAKNKFYGFPLWASIPKLVKYALLNFALYSTSSKLEAARLLGINELYFIDILNKYKLKL